MELPTKPTEETTPAAQAAAAAAAAPTTTPAPATQTTENAAEATQATSSAPAAALGAVQEVPAATAADVPPPEQAASQAQAETGTPAVAANAPAATEVPVASSADVPPPEQAAEQAKAETGTPAAGETDGPVWPDLNEEHPLTELLNKLPDAVKEADGYNEVYGIILNPENPDFHTKLICQKFLRANHNFADKAREQLVDTLKWRKEFQPLKVKDEVFSREKFEGLGFVVELEGVGWTANKKDVVTFNVYGAVKDNKMTFGDGDAFIRWRVALMELSIAALNLSAASQPIPDWGAGPDPYQAIQVHDYLSVSFFRQDPHVKAASKKTIDLFQKVYPETLSRKYFVNVPTIMGWMFSAMKLFLSKDTVQKFTVLSSGDNLVEDLGEGVPVVYGGKARSLEEIGTETKLE